MKHISPIILAIVFLVACSVQPCSQGTTIQELSFFRVYDTMNYNGSIIIYSGRHYIVNNDCGEMLQDTLIKNLVHTVVDSLSSKNDLLGFSFYKQSSITNEAHLKEFRRDIDRYSQQHDLLYRFNWDKKNGVLTCSQYNNGEIIMAPGSEIKIEDIKPPK